MSRHIRRAGHRTAMLTTDPSTRAERFYRAAGWKIVGTSTRGELIFRAVL
jgi:hypothetical protein